MMVLAVGGFSNVIMESRPLALEYLVFQAIGVFGSRNLSQFLPSLCLG